jgi:5-methylcytosine-specific restriction endonuclease McrA
MPKGVYIRSQEEIERCWAWGKSKKGSRLSEEHKKKIGSSLKGQPVWNQNLNKRCSIDSCSNKHFGHGLCSKHYSRFRRYGNVNIVKKTGVVYHSEESKRLMSEKKKGYKHTIQSRIKLSIARRSPYTKIKNYIRKSFIYRMWRTNIFERDDYTCQICGERGGKLQVDHYPKSYSEIIYDNNIKTFEDAVLCDELWDVKNNRTLCIDCHKETPNYLNRFYVDKNIKSN